MVRKGETAEEDRPAAVAGCGADQGAPRRDRFRLPWASVFRWRSVRYAPAMPYGQWRGVRPGGGTAHAARRVGPGGGRREFRELTARFGPEPCGPAFTGFRSGPGRPATAHFPARREVRRLPAFEAGEVGHVRRRPPSVRTLAQCRDDRAPHGLSRQRRERAGRRTRLIVPDLEAHRMPDERTAGNDTHFTIRNRGHVDPTGTGPYSAARFTEGRSSSGGRATHS